MSLHEVMPCIVVQPAEPPVKIVKGLCLLKLTKELFTH